MSTWEGTWKRATIANTLKMLTNDLSNTPRWRVFKRRQLKRSIKLWRGL